MRFNYWVWFWRKSTMMLAFMPMLVLIYVLMAAWHSADYVMVQGRFKHVDRGEIAALFRLPMPAHGQTLSLIAGRFAALPWVKQVFVVRDFPRGIRIVVLEREPMLRWGDHDFIDRSGLPFHRGAEDKGYSHLPYLIHRKDMPFYVVYGAYRRYKALLVSTPWVIDRLVFNDGQGWVLSLNHRVRLVLGRMAPEAHLKRFIAYADQLPLLDDLRSYVVDARYQKGFAVLLHR